MFPRPCRGLLCAKPGPRRAVGAPQEVIVRNLPSRVTIVPYLCLLCPGTTHDIMQDADAECRMQNRAQSCELHPMQDADAECRMQNAESGPKPDALAPDAGCRMRMQDAESGSKL